MELMGRHRNEVKVDPSSLSYGEVMWAAGFFDGEGNANFRMTKVKRTNGTIDTYPRITVQITQNDPEVLFRFQAAVGGLGTVRGPYAYNGKVNGQPWYRWASDSPNPVYFIIRLLAPHLSSIKRKQAEEALALYTENEVTPNR